MKHKRILILNIAFTLIVLTVSIVSANQKACITKGNHYPCPNPDKICKTDYCYFCVNDHGCVIYDKNCPGDPLCKGNATLDLTPPVLTINSPYNDQIYNVKSVIFSLTTDELATIYYKDNNDERGIWKKIATKTTSYNKPISLKDGFNDLTIRAVDMKGNEINITKRFRVDSQKPKITKISPVKGFATGNFEVFFTETNPKTLVLTYGNQVAEIKTSNIDLNQCNTLDPVKGKYYCSIIVPLTEFNGQSIDYNFRLTDIANNIVDSKTGLLNVDTSAPIFNNIGSMLNVNGKYVYFNISITEQNLLEVSYYDNSAIKPKWTKLCTSLKNRLCAKKLTFKQGNHIVEIKADDKAGNSATTQVEFNIA